MEFSGDELLGIIARQRAPLRVVDSLGRLERVFEQPGGALGFIRAGRYVGVGNRGHIRYIRPCDPQQIVPPRAPKGAVRCIVWTARHATCGQMGSHRTRRVGPASQTA